MISLDFFFRVYRLPDNGAFGEQTRLLAFKIGTSIYRGIQCYVLGYSYTVAFLESLAVKGSPAL
jgi:hypothetical protein